MTETRKLSEDSVEWEKEVRTSDIRLDKYLSRTELPWSRSQIKKKIENEEILVNGESTKPAYQVKKGDVVTTVYRPSRKVEMVAEAVPISIVYEDEDLIVLNKQPGVIVHPAKGHPDGTLVNALLYHSKKLAQGFGMDRPGVVHRLDMDTSGVIVFAKTDRAHSGIAVQFQEREVSKSYFTLVWGKIPLREGEINAPIGKHPVKRTLQSVTPLDSKDSLSRFKVLYSFPFASILKVMPVTGRTHQIRVHLSHYGYPVIGDPDYGGRDRLILRTVGREYAEVFEGAMEIMGRQALHAASLTITHPVKGEKMTFNASLYRDMRKLIRFFNEVNNS